MKSIKKARQAKGMTQAELADRVGVTQTNVSGWETGKWDPSETSLRKLSRVLFTSKNGR